MGAAGKPGAEQRVGPNLVPCPNLVLSALEPPAHTLRALESCWHAGEGLPCCPVTSSGTSGAANRRAGEEYQVKARYQVRANPLLKPNSECARSPFLCSACGSTHTESGKLYRKVKHRSPPTDFLTPTAEARPVRRRSRRSQGRGAPHTEHGLGVLLALCLGVVPHSEQIGFGL